ncbi:unnamed protein product [Lota lota]
MCTDEDWGSGCPSGCVLQVLFLQQEVEVEKRMLEVCKGLEQHHHTSLSTLSSATLLYHTQRHALISQHDWELWYVAGANRLASKLRLLRKLSAASSQKLKELRQKVQKQMEELYHTEVDVDIKIRACQGSCASRLAFRLQVEDQIALSPPTPPRRELPDIAPSTPQGQRKQLEHFGDIEGIQLSLELLSDSGDCKSPETLSESGDAVILETLLETLAQCGDNVKVWRCFQSPETLSQSGGCQSGDYVSLETLSVWRRCQSLKMLSVT